ncbi:d3bf834f-0bec-4ee6-9b1f-a03e7d2ea124 [Sclerotinia trifoliorum]|uniref:D3bf834f-0bec-4ee6-9b1f-a03e7d2ea124 n=1 Tax=Sclerotinia trifoliorum TaxID=28548 RepID=A0A8H2VVA8_9HELO|nr:d3bf834f-0bec-4ee6-9b1f-a03e7d2ea124 [Sclerotinia trifoliorum]
MADDIDEDTPMRTEDNSSDDDSGSDSEQNGGEGEVEWMVTSRQKRSTAGNRLNALLQQEEPDDELELLFAEDENEEDHGFVDVEADSDVQMDSSDDDDEGPAAGADDLEGEKELQRKEKAERLAKKRKMNDGIPKIFKKRVKIDPTIPSKPAPRPKKKSERASWIPTPEDAPTRASARGTTKKSKEQLHAQMIDREKKRLKQLANMEKAAAAKEAARKPAMTQEDRLAEAARVEKSNSKSLSRWEEAEQQREEEQRLKLAALHNRKLEGPVITWWSGRATWVGGKLIAIGSKKLKSDEPKEKSKKRRAGEMEDENEPGSPESTTLKGNATQGSAMANAPISDRKDSIPGIASGVATSDGDKDGIALRQESTSISSDGNLHPHPESQLSSILKPPQLPTIPPLSSVLQPPTSILQPPTSILQPPNQTSGAVPSISGLQPPHQTTGAVPHINGPLQLPQSHNHAVPIIPLHAPSAVPPFFLQPPSLDGSKPLPGFQPPNTNYPRLMPPQATPFSFATSQHYSPYTSALPLPPPPQPPVTEYALKNCLILTNFNEEEIKNKDVQTRILFNQAFPKAPTKTKTPSSKSHTLCAITHYPAKFRDPKTGLPYLNCYAYKEIQKLRRGEYRWSKLLGAYVGNAAVAARGVPGRFLKGGEKDVSVMSGMTTGTSTSTPGIGTGKDIPMTGTSISTSTQAPVIANGK